MANSLSVACILMASGFSTRFGSNKLLAPFMGQPMIERLFTITEALFSQRIVVTRYEEISRLASQKNISVLLHHETDLNDTIRLGLSALDPNTDGCMFCPCDQPLLTAKSLAGMLNVFEKSPKLIIRAAFLEQYGTPVIFPAWTFEELKTLPEGSGGRFILNKYRDSVKSFHVDNPWELSDIDTPGMLSAMEAIAIKHAMP